MAEFVPPFIIDLYTEGSPTAELHEALDVAPEDLIVTLDGFAYGAKARRNASPGRRPAGHDGVRMATRAWRS